MLSPLAGIRVVSIALNAPGPVAAAHLRAAGAEVTKVEPPDGDPLSRYCRGWYDELHCGVRVERIDLKSAGGRSQMRDWLRQSDLFLASQRPAALARLGLDTETLLAHQSDWPALRWINIVGELSSPETPGHDLTYLARKGLLGRELPRSVFADIIAAERAFATALLLLRQPPGAHASVGLFDSLAEVAAPLRYGLTGAGSLLGGGHPAYGLYPTRHGRIAVAALEPHFEARLYQALGLPQGSALESVFLSRTAQEWEAWASERDLPLTAVVT